MSSIDEQTGDRYFPVLLRQINTITRLTETEADRVSTAMTYREYASGQLLVCAGQPTNQRFFIIEGLCSTYCTRPSGKEQVLQLLIEHWWAADHNAVAGSTGASFSIRALEPLKVFVLEEETLNELVAAVPAFERYLRVNMQRAYAQTLKKVELLLCTTPVERLTLFRTKFPSYIKRIPPVELASFLSLDPEELLSSD